ncbi:glycosyltransferase [Flavobacteriaceae bacterium]|nr:glycosyltransferase [Flavobacteriaceae bacterium]
MHVLIKAHEISPLRGSECSNGWNFVKGLSDHVKLTVVHAETNQFGTVNYKDEIKTVKLNNDVEFISVKQPFITRLFSKLNVFLSRNNQGTGISILYFFGVYFWELKVYQELKKIDLSNFDIIHNLNHISYREPSFLWKFNIPFVWGPTSGIGNIPLAFAKKFSLKFRIIIFLRTVSNFFQTKFSKRIILASKKASKIFYVSKEDEFFFKKFNKKIQYLPDVTIEKTNFNKKLIYKIKNKINLIWVGRIDSIKSLDILLKVFKINPNLKDYFNIKIIGKGLLQEELANFCKSNNIDNVKWVGQINREKVKNEMLKSDLLVHTSIKEASATVIMEALSCELPVICHDAFGMSKIINSNIGFKIPYLSEEKSINHLNKILVEIKKNPILLFNKSKNIKEEAEKFTNKNIIKEILLSYEDIVNSL